MMIRTQVYLPEELHRDLKLLALAERVNYSQLIRDGAREVIRKKAKKRMTKGRDAFIGALTYGQKDLSNSINDIYT